MKTIVMQETLGWPAEQVWEIISDITRTDWVPAVESIREYGGIRTFEMAGIGEVQEKILRLDHKKMLLRYSAIKTPSMVEHHLATLRIKPLENKCQLTWTAEIEPEKFADAITHGMETSLRELQKVLTNTRGKPVP